MQELDIEDVANVTRRNKKYKRLVCVMLFLLCVAIAVLIALGVMLASLPRGAKLLHEWNLNSSIPEYSGRHVLPLLPVLNSTVANRIDHDEWHAYYERVYGHPVQEVVDLNTFNWLYNFAPLYLYGIVPVPLKASACPLGEGCVWYSDDLLWVLASYRHYGFFVTRESVRYDAALPFTEILHHTCASEDDTLSNVWLFVMRGSGVFVDSTLVQSTGRLYANASREEITIASGTQHRRSGCISDITYTTGAHGGAPCACDARLHMSNCFHPIAPLQRRQLTNIDWC